MARKAQKVIDNPFVMPIFSCLFEEPDNSVGISNKLGKAQSTIFEHLKNLEKEGYIKKINSNKLNTYEIDKYKLMKEVYQYMLDVLNIRLEKVISKDTITSQKADELLSWFDENLSLDNKYIFETIKYLIKFLGLSTIRQSFNELITYLSTKDLYQLVEANNLDEDKVRTDYEFQEFIEINNVLRSTYTQYSNFGFIQGSIVHIFNENNK